MMAKNVKKLVALLIALIMVISAMSISAAAADVEISGKEEIKGQGEFELGDNNALVVKQSNGTIIWLENGEDAQNQDVIDAILGADPSIKDTYVVVTGDGTHNFSDYFDGNQYKNTSLTVGENGVTIQGAYSHASPFNYTKGEQPTEAPTEKPTEAPAEEPTEAPTEKPTEAPTEEPTEAPTEEPTEAPTEKPTEAPTEEPTEAPTEAPTEEPTEAPTEKPTEAPTEEPTEAPTEKPTEAPTEEPTEAPTEKPTEAPTEEPTEAPIEKPTDPPVEPTDPPVEPTDPPVVPTNPPVEPTDPPVETPAPQPQPEQNYGIDLTAGDGLIDIFDDDVPLADVPKTGDISTLWMVLSGLSAGGLLLLKKKKED